MSQRHFISVRHPLASAASSTPPQIPLGKKTLRNDKELPLGDETPGTKEELHPLANAATSTPPQLPLGDETPGNNPLASAATSTPPQIPLGDKTPRNKKRWRARHHRRHPSFPWGTKPRGTQNSGERGIIDATPASLEERNPKEHKTLASAASSKPPQLPLGNDKPRGTQNAGERGTHLCSSKFSADDP